MELRSFPRLLSGIFIIGLTAGFSDPLGLPPVPVPDNNPITRDKIELGLKLFQDKRFSSDGTVGCITCHDNGKAFTDSPLQVSEGIGKLTGTRNAPTVLNAAYFTTQFWDGREPDLEGQSKGPFINPVEMGLPDHSPVVDLVRSDPDYLAMFRAAFGIENAGDITIDHVAKAIATFERTLITGDSPFDKYWFGGDESALNEAQKRGFDVFLGDGRCVSCHTISQNYALFTDNRFHNINVSFDKISNAVHDVATRYQAEKQAGADTDIAVLTDADIAELGRFAVTGGWKDIGSFKTATLRNIALTAPYMHDGSVATLEDVVEFYNNGGRVDADGPLNDFLSGGIRPLDLKEQQKADLVKFLSALTSPASQTRPLSDKQ